MKHLKTFENLFDEYQNFFGNTMKVGDYVKCIDDKTNVKDIKLDHIYIIEDVKHFNMMTDIKIIGYWWSSTRFIPATPEEIERYELEQNTNKYNL